MDSVLKNLRYQTGTKHAPQFVSKQKHNTATERHSLQMCLFQRRLFEVCRKNIKQQFGVLATETQGQQERGVRLHYGDAALARAEKSAQLELTDPTQ